MQLIEIQYTNRTYILSEDPFAGRLRSAFTQNVEVLICIF